MLEFMSSACAKDVQLRRQKNPKSSERKETSAQESLVQQLGLVFQEQGLCPPGWNSQTSSGGRLKLQIR